MNEMRKLNPKKVGAFAACVFLLILMLIIKGSKSPKIALNGDSTIDIELGKTYTEEGATAKYGNKDITKKIKITDNIDVNNTGKYYVTYTAEYKNKTSTLTRTVNVVDKIAPEMEIYGGNEISIEQDSTYKDFGCFAIDNYDGDISQNITISHNIDTSVLGSYTVDYTVKDSSGNESIATRTVNVVKKGSSGVTKERNTGVPVLMYHKFYDKEKGESGQDNNYMEIHDFEEQLKYLVDNKYYFPSWDELRSFIEGKTCLPKHSVIITVDDGDESFFEKAIPVIEKYDVKVTAFVVTSWIKDKNVLSKYDKSKITFESHSHDLHKYGSNGNGAFLTISHDEALSDVKTSKEFLGKSTIFSYPYGQYSDACEKILQEAGYELALTKEYLRARPGDNPYEIGRIKIEKGISLDSFIQRVS